MDGLLLVDKPAGITSHRVIEIIRQKLNIKRVGHAGTLDPLATGLLIIMVGKATKLSNQLVSQFKTYQVAMKLFLETDTGDRAGKIVKNEAERIFEKKLVQAVVKSFDNYTYWQQPPLYSAIKIKGKKLYQYARQGLKVVVPPRQVVIKSAKLVSYEKEKNQINIIVECSKGTYIRSLVKDMAERLGTVATVSQLRRISSGNFQVKQAIKMAEIKVEKIIAREDIKW